MAVSTTLLKAKKLFIWKKISGSRKEQIGLHPATIEAGDSLLRAIKARMLEKHGKIDDEMLRKEGYSEALIARLRCL